MAPDRFDDAGSELVLTVREAGALTNTRERGVGGLGAAPASAMPRVSDEFITNAATQITWLRRWSCGAAC